MKKIINGKKYDTDTAKEIAFASNNLTVRDFGYWSETLYQKKTGEFFMHGVGGSLSKYAERYPDGWGWGESIIPLTPESAKKWAERHLSGDDYEALFGEVEE